MKKCVMLTLLFLCLISPVYAQDIDTLPMITVSGTAEIQVTPDEVVFSLDVTKTHLNLQTAKRLNDDAVAKILELTRRFSILPQHVQTSRISVEMKYDSIRDPKARVFNDDGNEVGKRVFRGYEVSKSVTVKLTDISRFESFFAEVLTTGVSEVGSVRFETSKLRENKDRAREMAMKAAQEKAAAMASAVGQTIGRALRITEGNVNNLPYANLQVTANSVSHGVLGGDSEPLATFAPGAIKVEAKVTVSFQLN